MFRSLCQLCVFFVLVALWVATLALAAFTLLSKNCNITIVHNVLQSGLFHHAAPPDSWADRGLEFLQRWWEKIVWNGDSGDLIVNS